jgi:hypothetical protein
VSCVIIIGIFSVVSLYKCVYYYDTNYTNDAYISYTSQGDNDTGPIEVPLDALPTPTLRKLQKFVDEHNAQRSKRARKGAVSSAGVGTSGVGMGMGIGVGVGMGMGMGMGVGAGFGGASLCTAWARRTCSSRRII